MDQTSTGMKQFRSQREGDVCKSKNVELVKKLQKVEKENKGFHGLSKNLTIMNLVLYDQSSTKGYFWRRSDWILRKHWISPNILLLLHAAADGLSI